MVTTRSALAVTARRCEINLNSLFWYNLMNLKTIASCESENELEDGTLDWLLATTNVLLQ